MRNKNPFTLRSFSRRLCLRAVAGLFLLWLAGCAGMRQIPAEPQAATVTIYNTGDLHEHTKNLARIARFIKQRKAQDRNVLFVDAGDRFARGELPIVYTRGEAMTAVMAACAYDVCAMGNHDVAFGAARAIELARHFSLPLAVANCRWAGDHRPEHVPPYRVFELEGVTVAVIGSASEWMPARTDAVAEMTPLIDSLRELVPNLCKMADIIVLVSHHGTGHDKSVARAVPGIDLIVGGHDHACFREMVYDAETETVIQHSGDCGNTIGEVVFQWDGERIVERTTRIIEIKEDMPQDPVTAAVRARYFKALAPDSPVATAPETMSRHALTLWLADAVRKHTQVDVVLVDDQLAAKSLGAGNVTPQTLLAAVPRVEIVRFSVDGASALRLLLEKVREVRPNVIVHAAAKPAEGSPIRVAYPCVDYAATLDREAVGLDSPAVTDLERLRDRSLWQIAVEAARRQKTLTAPAEAGAL